MASLRDTFSFADPGLSQQGLEELQVQNMGTLRKGYAGGDIGTDANAAAAQLSALRANGQHAEADALQTELAALQQRQGLYAPEIGGVENIGKHGSIAGDAATWALENIGQGAASMQDPILATTAMNAGGRLLGMSKNPIAQLTSKALSWGAPAVAYGMNHEQLKGEFVQSAMRDPELMARTSWQDLNQTANVQALGGAALDTMLPTVLGRQIAGKKGMAALSKMAPTSFGGRTLAAMGLEGATEVGQTMGSQYALGHLNPNRVTSGDFMENVNAGLGGMVGAGPLAAVGAAAQGGHERLGGVADALGKKAGDTVDLATGAVDSAKEKGRSWWDRLTGGKKAEDLQGGEGAQALDPREIDVLLDKHLDPQTATDEDFLAADVERTGIVVKHLRALAETNDRAADLLGRVMDPGAGDQVRALDESANFLKEHYNVEELDADGRSLPSKGAELAGRAAKGIVKGAAKVAGDMISGAARGLASKKNLQADEGGSTSYTLADWEATQSYRRAAKHVALSSTKAEANSAEQTSRMNLAARQAAEFARTKYQGKEGLARMASHTAFELIDASRDFRRSDVAGTQPGARNARLGRVADTMRRLYGAEDAMKMADTIASIVGQDGNKYLTPAAEYVKAEIQRLETPAGRIQAKQDRQELAGKLASLVPPQRENFLLDKGINIRGQDADHFVRLLEKLADGTAPRDTRQELNRLFGAATVNNLLAELNQQAIATGKKETFKEAVTFADAPAEISEQLDVNDDGEVSSDDRPSDYDKRMGSKKVERGASGMMVAFDKISTTMSKGSGVDVFSGTKDGDTGEVKRPWLFKKGQKLFNGGDAIKNRIANLRGEMKGRADSYKVAARPAWDVMTEDGVQPGRVVAAYRDYLRQEATHDERRSKPQYTEAQRKAMRLEAMDAAKYVLDTMTPPKKGDAYRLPVGRRKEIAKATKKFFQERFVVTAESPSDRVSNRIDLDELNKMISATKKVVDLARLPDQDEAKLFNENNIISFTRRVKGEDKPAHIRADDLMKWGRNQRLAEEEFTEQSDFSNDNANDQYIADLMSGITAVMDSGFVRKKMPTKLNMKGKIESFADGIPPSLRLATTTQGKRNERRDEWLQGFENQRPDGPHFGPGHKPSQDGRYLDTSDFGPVVPYEEREVAPDQARSEDDNQTSVSDVDVKPDGFIQSGDNVMGGMMPGFPTQAEVRKSRETLRTRSRREATSKAKKTLRRRLEDSGELVKNPDPREAITVSVGEKKSDRKNVVPSETERQRETDDFGHKIAKDEFSDQRYRSRVEGFKPDANLPRPKSVMRAYADANRDAAEIVKALTPLPEGAQVVQAPGALGRPAEGFAMIEARLRAAVRPTEGGGLLGGMHFILPVLKVLNGDKLGTYDFSPEEAVKATELRGRAALAILGSKLPVPQRVRMAKELATAVAAERITEDNANTALWRIAQLGNAQAAPEVAAQEAPKTQANPSGAGRVDLGSRARHQGVKIVGTGDPTLAAASDTAAGRVLDEGVQAWRKGVTYKQFLASPEYLGAMHGLMVHKLMGTPGVQTEIDELNARAHQMFAIKYDKELEAAVMSRLSATDENTPAKLRDMMREILIADVDPATKVIARAVNTVAGDVDVIGTRKADIRGNSGVYNSLTKVIRVAEDADLGHAGTVLHEGVHAATVAAVIRDKGLHRAVYRLMDHVIEQNPRLRDAYGLTTSLEFLAEGLGNISFQRELAKIKPNDAVSRYLGKTVANAWDAFVGMVRTALNLDPKHESALAQLLDLGGRAMLTTKANPSGLTHAEFETFVERGVAPEKRARELADAMVNSRQIEAADQPILRQTLKDLVDGVVQDGLVPHKIVVAMATTLETFNLLLAGQTIELGSIFTALDANINSDASAVPSKAGRKLNAQSNEIHDDLGRPGFAATHDSPIRHEGKFDWRAHKGKGEGNAAFGAGTYLSTANGVHKSYKEQFTAALADTTAQRVWEKSPTYQVSVNIAPEQLLDWNKPLSEQSEAVQKALAPWIAATKERAQKMSRATGLLIKLAEREGRPEAMLGEKVYYNLTQELGSQAAASDYLQSLGILGHRFASSGGKNDTHPNYVIYDDSKITTNYVHFNQQDARTPRDTPASPEEIAKAKAWMNKVLPKVRVEFEKLTGYSGEFIEAENLVKISTTAAAGVMQTAYHEGLHAFFAGLAKNPEALRVMSSIADNRVIFRRLQALLAKYPAAQKQLVDGEERLAYAFQFWAAGKLQLPIGPAKGFFAKLRKFFRQVAGLIKDEEKAADIFQAFNDGKLGDPSTAGKVLNDILAQGTWTKKSLKRLDGLMQRARQLIMPGEEILMRAPSAEAKALARQLFTNPGDEGSAGMQEGLLNAQRTTATKEMNRFANAIAGLDDKDMANVAKLLEAKTPLNEIPYAPYLKAVKEIRQQLNDFGGKDGYLQKSGMEMGTVKDDYFPRVWSLTKLIDGREDFVKMLMDNYPERLAEIAGAANLRNTKHGKLLEGAVEMDNKAAAEEITNYLIRRNGTDGKVATQREDGVLAPYFAAGEKREFAWIETQKSEPWQNKNLIGIMTGYLREGVRSAEYTRRFGRKGEHLDASLRTIEAELTEHARAELAKGEFKDQKAANAWVTRQMRGIRQATGAMEGSLGKDISDRMRKFNSWMMVYQNVRLLPLTLFASVVDPLGMIARGATMREAFEAFQRGIQEVFRGWADLFRQEPKGALSDKWTKLAEHIGAVDAAILSHHASEEYSSTYLSHGAKQINDAFFKINGMEAWNRGMRVGAVKAAAAFIARHKALPEVHSQRWLTELGLTPDQITLDGEGNLITDMQDLMDQTGVSKTEAKRQIDAIHAALNRWTLGAVLTPNAAQRPPWSSDPHYSMFFHLKQFSYSFHQTILKRAVKEMNYGNMRPIAAFAGYIPVMIASDVMKGLIMGGGTLPNHMQGMDLGDWVMHGLERSGTLGIGAIGVDASQDMFSVLGPGVEQLVDGITEPIADTTLRAMPLNPLVRAMME
jgi:hypothetical protein